MKIIKKVSIFIFIIILGCNLFGCTKNTKLDNKEKKKLKGSITIVTAGIYSDVINSISQEFIKENPGVNINVKSINNDLNKVPIDYISNNNFDLIQLPKYSCSYIVNKYPDKLMDITSIVNNYKNKGCFLNNFTSEVVNEKSNKIYCIPWSVKPVALYYRKDIFESLGINVRDIKTWNNYIEAGKKINEFYKGKVKIIGVNYNDSYDILLSMLNQLGGKFYDSKGKVYLYNDKFLKVLNIQKQMIDNEIILNLEDDWNDRIFYLKNNQLATVPYSLRYSKVLKELLKDQSGKWGIMKLPAFENGGNQICNFDGSFLGISNNTKNKDISIEFMKYIVTNDKANKICLKYGILPGYRNFYSNSIFEHKDDYFQMKVENYFTNMVDGRNLNYQKQYPYIKDSIKDISLKNISKQKDLKSFLEVMSKNLDKIVYKEEN